MRNHKFLIILAHLCCLLSISACGPTSESPILTPDTTNSMGHSETPFPELTPTPTTSITRSPLPSPTFTPKPSATAFITVTPIPTVALEWKDPQDAEIDPLITAWLQEHAIPLGSGQEMDEADLMQLRALIGDARIVALGEANHGSHEFFQAKQHLIEFMVEEMDFTVVAMETSGPYAAAVNDWVQGKDGEPYQLVGSLSQWIWNTQEVMDFFRWMRRYNTTTKNGSDISFYGFDIQAPRIAITNVSTYVKEIDPENSYKFDTLYNCFLPYSTYAMRYDSIGESGQEACREKLNRAYNLLVESEDTYIARSSSTRFYHILRDAWLIVQSEAVLATEDRAESLALRDQYMADNIVSLLDHLGYEAKVILWAHNGHVRNRTPWMGSYLREKYGEEMLTIGMTFYGGAFNATVEGSSQPPSPYQVDKAPSNSYEYYFHTAGINSTILDLRGVEPGDPKNNWLFTSRPLWSIGSIVAPDCSHCYDYPPSLPEELDAILYFETISPSTLLPNSR